MTREEAIQTICNIYQTDKEKLALEFLIPELKTYKEDAIKRDIAYAIKCCYTDERAQPMFDWLKKKNTVNIEHFKSYMLQYLQDATNKTDDSEIEADTDKWAKKLLDLIGVQSEWSDDIICKAVKEVGLTQHQIEWFKNNVFPPKQHDSQRTWYKSLPDGYNLQPKQEWSEEDIKKIRSEEYTKGFNDAAFGGKLKEWSVEDEDRIRQIERIAQEAGCTQKLQEEIHDWLKSLRLQLKQEWSEEDKGLLLSTKCIIDEVWHSENTFGYSKEELEEIWNWLNVAWTRLEYPKENDEWSEDDLNRIRNLIFLVENSNEGSETKKGFVKFLQRLYIKSQIKKI